MGRGDKRDRIDELGATAATIEPTANVDELGATIAESGESIPTPAGDTLATPAPIDAMGETVATPNPDADDSSAPAKPTGASKRSGGPALSSGDKLGRYVVLELLGAGGMGEVYTAYDPELDRRVALKVIHPAMQETDSHAIARGRLLREAKAMAQLSHPNVISVFDVGTVGDDVYVAMEFIDGCDLRQWSKQQTRTWDEVIRVFAAAGRGLAAAHDSAMVHRDFKPDNVLIGSDGRVRVIDFGLAARRDGEQSELGSSRVVVDEAHETLIEQSRTGGGDVVTTQAGSVLGTPAYMAPEQFEGADTDARTDQFNFAVALYEALFGERPFEGEDYTALAANVTTGTRRAIPKASDVPTWLADAVSRGLSKNPESRYETMHELVAALSPPETLWSRHKLAIGAGAAVVLIGGVLAAQVAIGDRDRDAQVCTGLDQDLAGIWDADRKKMVRDGILATGLPYAKDAYMRVDRTLGAYTDGWVAARIDACEDSAVRKEQSQDMLGKRMDCLDRRLHELDAIVTVIASADDSVVANAAQAAASLTPVARCSNKALLATRGDDEAAKTIDRDLARVKALDAAGQYQAALALSEQTLARLRDLPSRPREARALRWIGVLQSMLGNSDKAIETLFEAVRVADTAADTEGEAQAWVSIAGITSAGLGRTEEAERWIEHAKLAIEQAGGGDIELQAKLHHQTGIVYFDQKRYDMALPEFRSAAALYERAQGKGYFRGAISSGMAGSTLRRLNRNAEAADQHMRALETLEAALGSEHPRVASMLNNVANSLGRVGRFEQAKQFFERSLSIKRKTVGENHKSVASTLINLGGLEERTGLWDDAIARYDHALAIRKSQLKADHPAIPRTLQAIARVHRKMGSYDLAVREERNVLLMYESIYGADHDRTSDIRTALCDALLRVNRVGEAVRECDHAVKSLESAPDQRNLAWALTYAGLAYVANNKPAEAVNMLERALKLRSEHPGSERYLAETKFALATALGAANQDAERATKLAREAAAVFEAGPIGDAEFLPAVKAWLAKR